MAKLIAEYRAEEFSRAAVSYIALKQVAHAMVCLSESHRGQNFRDVICARRYYSRILNDRLGEGEFLGGNSVEAR